MDKHIRQFFSAAKKLNLSKSERLGIRTEVLEASDRQLETMLSGAQEIGLTKKEKQKAFARIESFINTKSTVTRDSFSFSWLVPNFQWRTLPAIAIVVGLLFTSGIGVSYAAEGAMPGDTLYPVKILNENVREQFIYTPEKKAEWVEQRIERRFEEMQNVLQDETKRAEWVERLEQRIELHSERLEERIATIESPEKAMEIRERLEQQLAKREEFIASLKSSSVSIEQFKTFIGRHRQRHGQQGQQMRAHFKEQIESDPELKERFQAVREEIRKQKQAVAEKPETKTAGYVLPDYQPPDPVEVEAIKQVIREERAASRKLNRPDRFAKNRPQLIKPDTSSVVREKPSREPVDAPNKDVRKPPTREERAALKELRDQEVKNEVREQIVRPVRSSRSSRSSSQRSLPDSTIPHSSSTESKGLEATGIFNR